MSIKLTEQQQQDLLAYVEGTLTPDAAARMEVFLANTDPQLAAQIADMIDQRQAVKSLPKLKAPGDMAQRIMEQVERESLLDDRHQGLDGRPWWQSRWLMAASVLMVVSVFGYYVIHAAMKNSDTMDKWQVAKKEDVSFDKQLGVRDLPPAPNAAPEPQQQADQQGGQQAAPMQEQARVLADAPNSVPANENLQRQALARNESNYQAPLNQPLSARPMPQNMQNSNMKRVYGAVSENAPVVVTLAARDPSDAERLRLLLLSMMTGSTTMKSAASAPAKIYATDLLNDGKTAIAGNAGISHGAGSELLQARLTPEAFRRISSQFTVVSIATTIDGRSRSGGAGKEMAASADQDGLVGAAPMSGEADYVFRFVSADAAKTAAPEAARAIMPAAAPAAKPVATQPATQAHP